LAYLIDPKTQTLTPWQPEGNFLTALRNTLECTQLDSVMLQRGLTLWLDNFGMLQPGASLFRFTASPQRFAGKAIITSVDPDGMPTDLPAGFDPAVIVADIDWCPGEAVTSIREELTVVPTEMGPWPRVTRTPEFSKPALKNGATAPFTVVPVQLATDSVQPPTGPGIAAQPAVPDLPEQVMMEGSEPPRPLTVRWTVVSDDVEDCYVATQYDYASGQPTGREAVFKELADVAAHLAKQGAERLPDNPEDPDEVVAQFVA
jgi:hypothetical protein